VRRWLAIGGVILLGAVPFCALRAHAQNAAAVGGSTADSAPLPGSVVRTVASADRPSGIAVDTQGRLYVAANNRVYRVTPSTISGSVVRGAFETVAGTGAVGSLGDGGPAIAAELHLAAVNLAGGGAPPSRFANASGLAADPAGNIFIGDAGNETVRRVDAETGVISSVAGKWANGAAGVRPLAGLAGIASDANGTLFFAAANSIYRLDANSGALTTLGNVAGAGAIAVTRDGGSVYVASAANEAIYALGLGANGAASEPRWVTGLKTAPTGIAVDPYGALYVSLGAFNIIVRIDANAAAALVPAHATTIAGTGAAGHTGDGGSPLAAEFNAPGTLALDRDGNLFVIENGGTGDVREITEVAHVSGGVTLSPNTFNFPVQLTGGSTAPQAFTLTNNSGATVTGINVTFAGGSTPPDFTETNTCGSQIAAGASCTINIVFAPQASGTRSAALHVTDSDASSPQAASLSGVGDDFELAVQPAGTPLETILAGNTATYLLQATPDNLFSGTITLNCPVNLPLQTTCTLTPTTLTLTPGGAPQTFSLALGTTARTTSSGPIPTMVVPFGGAGSGNGGGYGMGAGETFRGGFRDGSGSRFPAPRVIFAATLGVLAMLTFVAWRRRKLALVAAVGIFALLAIAPACNNSTNTTVTGTITKGTPAGTYHLNATATAQNTSRAVSLTLVVQ
jgi:sugar lactone lactonase YvrE